MNVRLLDYGAGNLHSLAKAMERLGARVEITADWDRALSGDALVLPGVGAFGAAVDALADRTEDVRAALHEGLPCLGICLGMQLFFDRSEEGEGAGIGVIPGTVRRLATSVVPQMGWNDVEADTGGIEGPDPIFEGTSPLVAYYANSFVCEPADPTRVVAWTTYDGLRFPAAVRQGRSVGVQFHPEKSSTAGLRLIQNFLAEAAP